MRLNEYISVAKKIKNNLIYEVLVKFISDIDLDRFNITTSSEFKTSLHRTEAYFYSFDKHVESLRFYYGMSSLGLVECTKTTYISNDQTRLIKIDISYLEFKLQLFLNEVTE